MENTVTQTVSYSLKEVVAHFAGKAAQDANIASYNSAKVKMILTEHDTNTSIIVEFKQPVTAGPEAVPAYPEGIIRVLPEAIPVMQAVYDRYEQRLEDLGDEAINHTEALSVAYKDWERSKSLEKEYYALLALAAKALVMADLIRSQVD